MAKVVLNSARTTATDPNAAADDLLRQLGESRPKLVTMFASRERDQRALNRAVRERLPKDVRLVGATSGGELDNAGFHQKTVLLAGLSGDFDVGLGLGRGLSTDAVAAGAQAAKRACEELGVRPQDLDPRKHVGLVMDDGTKSKKEELLLGVLEKNPALTLVGGGANDVVFNPGHDSAEVHVDGEVATDAAVVALFRTDAPWAALRSHWYVPTGRMVRITKVDETCTRALEIDDKPAAQYYASLLGVPVEQLPFGTPDGFARHPTALRVGREYFLRSPIMPLPDGSILFANLLDEGSELELMNLGDPVAATRKFFEEELPHKVNKPSAALLFHCEARTMYARTMNKVEELGGVMKYAPPSAGFNVRFEIYSGFHINTTLTVLAFGATDE